MQNVVRTHQGVVHGSVAHEVVAFKGIPKYELSRRAMMRFDTPSQLVEDPCATERVLWEDRR